MLAEQWSHIVAASVAPVVIISASGLLCLAFYNRLAAVVTRLRGFHREQWHEQEALAQLRRTGGDDEALVRRHEMLGMLQVQIDRVTQRSRLLRKTLACLLMTISLLAACSLALGLSTVVPAAGYAAVPLFALGLLLLIASAVLAMLELRTAIDPVEMEGRFMRHLAEDLANAGYETVLEKA